MGRPPDADARWNAPIPPLTFPHANSERLDQAPPRCPKCGGIWQRVDEGYKCRVCPTRWRAAECLREMLTGTRDRERKTTPGEKPPARGTIY